MALGTYVIAPLVNPDASRTHVRVAAWVARHAGGTVVPMTVVRPSVTDEGPSRALIDAASRLVMREGATARGRIVVHDSVAQGVLDALSDRRASLAVMGWQGESTHSNVFGRLIDTVVGRATTPLAVVRPGTEDPERIVVPISTDHLLPGNRRGLELAAALAAAVREATGAAILLLRADRGDDPLPPVLTDLSDRLHRDPRRVDLAVGAVAGPRDLLVIPVAPTATGLRTATTHMAWAAPDATLVVAVDVGAPPEGDLVEAVQEAGQRGASMIELVGDEAERAYVVRVVVKRAAGPLPQRRALRHALAQVGEVRRVVAGDDPDVPALAAEVVVHAPMANAALGAVMVAVHEAETLEGAEIGYELLRS